MILKFPLYIDLQPSCGQQWQLGHGCWLFGHNFVKNRYILEILVSFDRVDQGLSNDTKFHGFNIKSRVLWSKRCKILRKLVSESIFILAWFRIRFLETGFLFCFINSSIHSANSLSHCWCVTGRPPPSSRLRFAPSGVFLKFYYY